MKFAFFALVFASLLPAQEAPSVNEQVSQLLSQGIITTRVEDSQAALPYFEKAAALDPKNADVWYELGMCRGRLGKQAAKVLALDKAVSLQPNDTKARHQLVLALKLTGQVKEARQQVSELKKYDASLAAGLEKTFTAPTQVASR